MTITDEMVENGCRGMYGKHWDGPKEYMPGEAMKDVWRKYSRSCLTAALGETHVGWKPIETAPKDGTTIFAACWQTGRRGMVHFNSQGEWEMVNGLSNMPMGIGFYPSHWHSLLAQPAPPAALASPDGGQNG